MYEQIYNLTSMFFILKTSFSVMQILLTVKLQKKYVLKRMEEDGIKFEDEALLTSCY